VNGCHTAWLFPRRHGAGAAVAEFGGVDILYNNASALRNGPLMEGTCQRGCLTEIWGRAGERVPPPLVPGDVVTLEVEGLGTVRNRVVDPAPSPPIPQARKAQPRGPRH
jgi:hypothetical protein